MIKYVVIPGWVNKTHVDAITLIKLYGVKPEDCVIWTTLNKGRLPTNLIELRPRKDGNYTLPRESDE